MKCRCCGNVAFPVPLLKPEECRIICAICGFELAHLTRRRPTVAGRKVVEVRRDESGVHIRVEGEAGMPITYTIGATGCITCTMPDMDIEDSPVSPIVACQVQAIAYFRLQAGEQKARRN